MSASRLRAVMRQELAFFLMKVFETLHPGAPPLQLSPYLRAMCYHLERASRGDLRRLVITVPPRHLKSISASVALVAWLLGHDPTLRIMVASYSSDLARQHAEQCRTIMESPWYRGLFPGTRISDRGNRQLELITTKGGARKAVSVGGSVTGFGADLIIVDDCMKTDDASSQAIREQLISWFDGTLMTRLNDKATGRVISIQQRLHEADLPAYLLDKGYHHLNLPAIAEKVETIPISATEVYRRVPGDLLNPARESREVLEELRRELGPMVFSAQYQQSPTVPEGNLIRLECFMVYSPPASRSLFTKIVQSWDTALTSDPRSDWSVCLTFGYFEGRWFLLDVLRQRLDYPELKRAVICQREAWKADKVLIEHAGTGIALVQELRAQGYTDVQSYPVRVGKTERLIAQLAEIETGKFVLPDQAPWLDAFESELRAFPNGRHDDQVDAFSQFAEFQKVRHRFAEEERSETGRVLRNSRNRYRTPYARP